MQGRHGRGWPGTRPGSARGGGGGKEPPGSPGSRRWEYQYSISVIASDQSAQPGGRVSVTEEQPTTESRSEGGRTAPCFKEKFGKIGVLSSTQLLMMFAWCGKQGPKPHNYASHSGSFLGIPQHLCQDAGLETHPTLCLLASHRADSPAHVCRGHHEYSNGTLDLSFSMVNMQDEMTRLPISQEKILEEY